MSVNFCHFSTYIFSADITPDMLKLCRVTNVKVLFLVLVYIFYFNVFEFSAAILEKGLLFFFFCIFFGGHLPQISRFHSVKAWWSGVHEFF